MIAAFCAPEQARAANGNKPRIPVLWSASPCAQVIDRSQTPSIRLEYAVPEEDLGPRTPDEVGDSRTHQFFAFRRLDFVAASTSQKLPRWITQADIDRSALIDPMVVPADVAPDDILEITQRFAASDWLRITADDARVPISDAQAAMGVDWDVGAVTPGTYTIWGYTWEPLLNLWSPRPGFVKIVASASDAAAAGPSVALLPETAQIVGGEPHALLGCVDAPEGSTITIEWGTVVGSTEPQWQSVIEDEPVGSGDLQIELVLPNAAADGATVKLRATVTDPQGLRHVAHSPGSYAVTPGDEPDAAPGGCGVASARAPTWMLLLLVGALRPRAARARLRS